MKWKPLLFVFFVVLTGAVKTNEKTPDQFHMQIKRSCNGNLRIEKSITDLLSDSGVKTETHNFLLTCATSQAKEEVTGTVYDMALGDEVAASIEIWHANPYISENFSVREEGACTVAFRLPGKEKKTPLVYQAIELDPATGNILYLESHTMKNSFLYAIEQFTRVYFNSDGTFRESIIEVKHSVALGSEAESSRIHVRAVM